MSLLTLPQDLLRWLCCFDDTLSPMDVARMRRVCRQLHHALSADSLWRALFARYYSSGGDSPTPPWLLVPSCATQNLVQRQRFQRSDREAAMLAARQRWIASRASHNDNNAYNSNNESAYVSFCRATESYSMAVWPARIFYIGLAEAGFAVVSAGQLRAPIARILTYHESAGRVVSLNGRRVDPVSPAKATVMGRAR